jgi:TPR repeat protein
MKKSKALKKMIKRRLGAIKLAADQGHRAAQFHMGLRYETGRDLQINDKEAVHYYRLAANQGHKEAQFNLGNRYVNGQGVEKNDKKAIYYYQLAAKQGHREAQFYLGIMYANGRGVEKSDKKAVKYYRLAADQGHRISQFYMGLRYAEGLGVEKDNKEAIKYYQLAADQGLKEAQNNLGVIYQAGLGVEKNIEVAIKYYRLAADQGFVEAHKNYIRIYHKLSLQYKIGYGVPKDEKKSDHFFRLATMVDEEDKFRQFVASRNLKNKLMNAPSLLIKVFEKEASGQILMRGLYDLILSPEVKINKCYVPWEPPIALDQRGPTCGLNALEIGLTCYPIEEDFPSRKVPPARENPIQPIAAEKKKNKDVISLRFIAKKYGSINGEVYNIHCLQRTAKHFKFDCKVIKEEKGYIQKVIDSIRTGHNVILPVDVGKDGFPGNMKGMDTHYALAWGIIYKNNQYYFLVTQYGRHYLWSAEALLKSHKQMPNHNPQQGEYYKDRRKDYYYPKKKDQAVPVCDLRRVPPSSLKNFKFTALAIPTKEKNFLLLSESKSEGKSVYQAVRSSNAIMLKLLSEAGANLRPSKEAKKTLQEIAEEKQDVFSLSVLKNAANLIIRREEDGSCEASLQKPMKFA